MSFFKAWFRREEPPVSRSRAEGQFRDQTAEFDVIGRHLRPGEIACDIGANKGSFIYWLSRWCGRAGWSRSSRSRNWPVAVRGLPRDRAWQRDGRSQGGLFAFRRAGIVRPAGHSPGASLTQGGARLKSFTTLSVPVVSLDDYFDANDKIALLKIDVEGAELGSSGARSGFCAGTRHCWFSSARTAISRRAMSGMYFPILRPGLRGQFRLP